MLARFRLGILFLSLTCSIWAQTTASTLAGVVKDGSGAVIPGAKVLVINEDSGVALTAVANQAGLYRVIGLSPASFRVEAIGVIGQRHVTTAVPRLVNAVAFLGSSRIASS